VYRLPRLLITLALLVCIMAATPGLSAAAPASAQVKVFVDTDIGVDDAVAIAWLLDQRQVQIVGFSTVFGNTSVENASRNLLTLLDAAGRQIPVTMGASAPISFPRTRTGAFIHGPDGFWFAQAPADISGLPSDAPAAIAAAARANPGITFIALGPLTNFARAVERFPADLAGARLVALGGGKYGNITPVAEFNIYADPQALDIVLASGMKVELVTIEAFEQVTVDTSRLADRLGRRGGAVGQLLAALLPAYAQAATQGASTTIALPDTAAAVYAIRGDLGTPSSALVRVITDGGYARGQTIIGDTLGWRLSLIADDAELSSLADSAFTPGFDINASIFAILMRQADNAQVILDVNERRMVTLIERSLTE
jgi:inosine-uridine nucleoside N-ribohydrolase